MIETINEESEEINVYLDPFSEEIVAIRSNQWRIWDFMWEYTSWTGTKETT